MEKGALIASLPDNKSSSMRTVAIYNASWATLGGGEKYACTLADTLAGKQAADVTILSDTPEISKEQLQRYFNLPLRGIRVEYLRRRDVESRLERADIGIIVSNVRTFGLTAKHSVYVLQIPYPGIGALTVIGRASRGQLKEAAKDALRLSLLRDARRSDLVLVYSEFVRNILRRNHGIQAEVLYPAIDDFNSNVKKKKIILSVGRFFSGLYNEKRYDVLIEAFKRLHQRLPKADWHYRLVGSCGSDERSLRYLESLRASAAGFPVEFHVNAPYRDLRRHYNEASLFWHAAGFGVDDQKQPERAEHFGMSTVEAMSARCVPLVVRKGGQKEIVSHGESGYLWDTIDELVERSAALIGNPQLLRRMSGRARARFRDFDHAHFSRRCLSLFHQLT